MDRDKLRGLAAKHFAITLDAVTNEHLSLMEDLQRDIAREVAQDYAPAKSLEELDLAHGADRNAFAMDRVSNLKSLPQIERAVNDPDLGGDEIDSFRHLWDNLVTLSVLRGKVPGRAELGPAPVTSLKYWSELETRCPRFTQLVSKAVDTATSGGGAEWAPTRYSATAIQALNSKLKIGALFPRVTQPADTWVLPFGLTGGTCYRAGEATSADVATYSTTVPATAERTFSAGKLVCRIACADEFEEDSIVPALPAFSDYATYLLSKGIEQAIIDGDDTTPTNQDGLTDTTDPRFAWDGLRYTALNNATTATQDLGTFTAENLLTLIGCMDAELLDDPENIVLIMNPKKRGSLFALKDAQNNLIFTPATARGDRILDGGIVEAANFFGNPIVTSGLVRRDLNASGVYDGSTTDNTAIIGVHRKMWWLTDRREIRAEVVRDPLKGLANVVVSWRGAFKKLQSATTVSEVCGYNLAN